MTNTAKEETLTLDDYLSLARNCVWVVAQSLAEAGNKKKSDYAKLKIANNALGTVIDIIDDHRATDYTSIPMVAGLPPNDALKKLVRIIQAQSGERSVMIGSSAFSVRQISKGK